jgi:hypothetical protein
MFSSSEEKKIQMKKKSTGMINRFGGQLNEIIAMSNEKPVAILNTVHVA